MRKKEFVHTHALLLEITQYLTENEGMPVEAYSAYDALDVRPSSIHEPKRNHSEAVRALGDAIERWLERTHTGSREQSVNRP